MVTHSYDFLTQQDFLSSDMSNKLFCTFSSEENLDDTLNSIKEKYKILYNKIFVLYIKDQNEYACTYNVDFGNVSNFLDHTILVHRKKETNTLYTINAVNALIKQLNGGRIDHTFMINWRDYRNCILLTRGMELKQINTRLHNIIDLKG